MGILPNQNIFPGLNFTSGLYDAHANSSSPQTIPLCGWRRNGMGGWGQWPEYLWKVSWGSPRQVSQKEVMWHEGLRTSPLWLTWKDFNCDQVPLESWLGASHHMKGLSRDQTLLRLTCIQHHMPARGPGTWIIRQAHMNCLFRARHGRGFPLSYLWIWAAILTSWDFA